MTIKARTKRIVNYTNSDCTFKAQISKMIVSSRRAASLSASAFGVPRGRQRRKRGREGKRRRRKAKGGKKGKKKASRERKEKLRHLHEKKKPFPLPLLVKGTEKGEGKKTAATCSPACAVPSARRSLTALFGMGRGGASGLWPPQ